MRNGHSKPFLGWLTIITNLFVLVFVETIKLKTIAMAFLFIYFLSLFTMDTQTIIDFGEKKGTGNWMVVDDVVMGGRSSGLFGLNNEGHAVFSGRVSLANNGGFSSVRCRMAPVNVSAFSCVLIRLKGDGKQYQFRVKDKVNHAFSYIAGFATTGEWQTIQIPFSSMYPSFRGQKLNDPNFAGDTIEEMAFLIGNKKEQDFSLVIDKISVE